jgi:hypothetical protein
MHVCEMMLFISTVLEPTLFLRTVLFAQPLKQAKGCCLLFLVACIQAILDTRD